MPRSSGNPRQPSFGRTHGDALSIRDFLTDGSVAGLCAELTLLTGHPIWLRDINGQVILPSSDERSWRVLDEPEAVAYIGSSSAGVTGDVADLHLEPMRISVGEIGWIAGYVPPESSSARSAMRLLASSVCDVCEAQLALEHRVEELEALYKISSIVARAEDPDGVLQSALDLAVEALHADAGTISVIEPGQEASTVKAAHGVADTWVNSANRLCRPGEIGAPCLQGETVICPLTTEIPECPELRRVMCTGLSHAGRTLGTLSLFIKGEREFSEFDRDLLKSIGEHIAAAINDANLQRLHEEDKRIQRQVRLAADVQRRMLPRQLPKIRTLDIAARYSPSFELSGDFYDIIELGGNLGVALGDVAGKGVASAMLMSSVRSSLRAHAQDVYELGDVMSRVNVALVEDTLDHEFATVWYGVIEPESLRLTYCTAGHEPAIVARREGDQIVLHELHAGGMALGIDPDQRYDRGVFRLRPGDVLVVYSDGLTDVTDFEERRFGRARVFDVLKEELSRAPGMLASELVERVFWHVRQFAGLKRRPDDITLTVVRAISG